MRLSQLCEGWRRISYDKLASRLAEAVILGLKRHFIPKSKTELSKNTTFYIKVAKWDRDPWNPPPKAAAVDILPPDTTKLIQDMFKDTLTHVARDFTLRVEVKDVQLWHAGLAFLRRSDDEADISINIYCHHEWELGWGGVQKSLSMTYKSVAQVLRHELEHLRQYGSGEKRDAYDARKDWFAKSMVRNLAPRVVSMPHYGNAKYYNWITDVHEIGAMVTDIHFSARRRGVSFEKELQRRLAEDERRLKEEGIPDDLIADITKRCWDFAAKKYPGLIKKQVPELKSSEPVVPPTG